MAPPKTLPTSQLGKNGPQVTRLGFGLMGLSLGLTLSSPTPSDEERFKVLDRAWELGEVFWDTASSYKDSEELVGKWFALHPERRADIFLATKFAFKGVFSENGKFAMTLDSSPEYCRESCETSLKRLGIESIDLFYVHRVDDVTPIERTMDMLVQLKSEGKIKYMGLSECSSDTLRRAHAVHPISAVQVEYNPWTLEIEGEAGTNLLKTCRELGVAVVPYSPLGRGFLSGQYKSLDDFAPDDYRRSFHRFSPENFSKNLELVHRFESFASEKGATASQAVLAWILSQGEDFFPIPGTRNVKYLEQNVGALGVTFTSEEDARVRELIGSMGPSGSRHSTLMVHPNLSYGNTPPLA